MSYGQTVVNVDGLRFLIENGDAVVGRQDKELSGDIVIPATIEYEGNNYNVTGLIEPTNVTAWSNNTVTTEGGAFQSCQISSVVIPSSITTIAAGAFSDCSNLTSVTLPSNLTRIGSASFANCVSLETIDIPETVTEFSSNSNYGTISYSFGGCAKLKTIHIPEGITTLYAGCFMSSGIDSIYIPPTITNLYDDCLSCQNLKIVKMGIADLSKLNYSQTTFGIGNISNADLYVPKGSIAVYQEYEPWINFNSIQEYGEEGEVFEPDQINISYDNIKYILKNGEAIVARQASTLSGNIVIPEVVTFKDVDYSVTKMIEPTDLVCYSGGSIVCTGGAFQGTSIETISIPSGITTIPAGAFQNCQNLTKVVLPETMKKLSAACFAGCYNLSDINIPEGITDLASNTVYGYRSYVFGGCSKIKTFDIPSGVTILASGCFMNSGLESVSVPSNCLSLDEACLKAPNLQTVTMYVRDLYSLKYSESSFDNVSKTTLRVPIGCKQVYQEYYPWKSFNSIEEFDDGNGEYVPTIITTKIDGIRYVLNNGTAKVGRQDKELSGDIIIPSSVAYGNNEYTVDSMVDPSELIAWSSNTVSTENGAFQGCPISSVTVPSTIKVIPAGAFYNCTSLESVNLAEGLTQIGAACFAYCSKLEEIQIPESVTDFGCNTRYGFRSYVFGGCSSLKKVNIPTGITKLTEGCFKGSGLQVFIIPSNVTILQEDCFSMNGLRGIKITHSNLDALTYTESIFSNVSDVSLYVPEGKVDLYNQFYPWKNFKEIIEYKDQDDEFQFNAYSIEYLLPSEVASSRVTRTSIEGQSVYNKDYIASGISVGVVEAPNKEGYTFNGWDNVPDIMPSHDVSITGTYSINKYKLTYLVDGAEYKSYEVEYGTAITAEAEPTKEGYTFSGWSDIPETMPAKDVTVTGSFTENKITKYTLTYKVDDEVYKTYELEEGAKITPEEAPTKEGYTFSGWSEIPETMPANDVTITGTFSINKYKLVYKVDNEAYKSYEVEYGATITAEAEPTKEGYTFSGWSEIPETMPAKDVTITGTFSINKYKLVYKVDGEEYKSYDVEYGAAITAEATPTKEGYEFSGWSDIPETMPAKDVTITGTFKAIDYVVDGATYEVSSDGATIVGGGNYSGDVDISSTVVVNEKTYTVTSVSDGAFQNNTNITSVSIPESVTTIGANAFNGCSNLGNVNVGKSVSSIGSKAFANLGSGAASRRATTRGASGLVIKCYATNVPTTAADAFENTSISNAILLVDDNSVEAYKTSAPWSGFGTIMGFNEAAGIEGIILDNGGKAKIFSIDGKPINETKKGVNIIRMDNGKTKKVVVR